MPELSSLSGLCYVSYLSRSGSTLLSRLLQERYEICITPEGSVPAEMVGVNRMRPVALPDAAAARSYLASVLQVSKVSGWNVPVEVVLSRFTPPGTSVDLFNALVAAYRDCHGAGEACLAYKGDPIMPWEAKAALAANPQARVIYVLRDPRAVLNSQTRSTYAYEGGNFSYSPAHTAREWLRLARAIETAGPREHLVCYEDLLRDTEATLAAAAAFLSAPERLEPAARSFADGIAREERHLHTKVSAPPDPSGIDSWRTTLDPAAQAVLERILESPMRDQGYLPDAMHSATTLDVVRAEVSFRGGLTLYNMRRRLAVLRENPRYFLRKLVARMGGGGAV